MSERPFQRARDQRRPPHAPNPFPLPFPYNTHFNLAASSFSPITRHITTPRPYPLLHDFFPSGHWSLFPPRLRPFPHIASAYPVVASSQPRTENLRREEDEGDEDEEEDYEDLDDIDDIDENHEEEENENGDSQRPRHISQNHLPQSNSPTACVLPFGYNSLAIPRPAQNMPPATNRLKRRRDSGNDQDDLPSRATKRRRLPPPNTSSSGSIAQIDLSGDAIDREDEDDRHEEDAQEPTWLNKQTEEAVRAQQSPVPSGKSKLTTIHCTVCLEPPTDLTATSCGHVFCRACLYDWLRSAEKDPTRRPNCPTCRKPLRHFRNQDPSSKRPKDTVNLLFMKKPIRPSN